MRTGIILGIIFALSGCYRQAPRDEQLEALKKTNEKLDVIIKTLNQPLPRLMGGKAPNGGDIYVRVDKAGWLLPLPENVKKAALKKEKSPVEKANEELRKKREEGP